MPSRPLHCAVIGLGVGQRLAEAIAAREDCSLVALCDIDPGKLASAKERFPQAVVTTRDADILDDDSVDMVCIASYDNYHFAQTRQALLNGKHVFVEKPFVLYEQEAREIRALLGQRPGCRLSSNLVLRTVPRFRDLKRRIEGGELGQLFHLEGDYDYGRLAKIVDGWRGRLPFYSAVHGGGVHIADLLMWLAQDRVEEVSAYGNAIASAGSGFANFDMVVAALRFRGGAVGKLGVNFGCVRPHFHRLQVYGTSATFENRPDAALLYTSREAAAAPAALATDYPGHDKALVVGSFIDSLWGSAEMVTTEDVFAAMSVCFAIERSAHEGRPVRVDYI